jgi:hypothetical protein
VSGGLIVSGAFGLSEAEMVLARACATRAAVKYGDDSGAQLESIRAGKIWNDHVAVQAAIETIKALKEEADDFLLQMRAEAAARDD